MSDPRQVPDRDEALDELNDDSEGEATTAEEAMDAATDEDGFVDESAYTPSTDLQDGHTDS